MLTSSGGYSADVELVLIVAGRQLPLGQVGPAYCILREPTEFEPGSGEIVVIVDGCETRVPAHFPQGATTSSTRVNYEKLVPVST